jgi:2-polyprenyl-3-methyl-5-hydroxy-6-metoxy-1,4-benzoquinol methylase
MYALPEDSPPLQGNANTTSYWDYIFKQEGWKHQRFYPALYGRVCDLVPENSKVVDIGCGTGVLLDMLTKKRHVRGYGIDFSEEAINRLKQKWLEGEVKDVRDLKMNHFPPKDTVAISTETLEHLDDERMEKMLTEMAKCKMAVVSTPEGQAPSTPAGEHLREFSKTSLRALLKKHFSRVKIETIADPNLAVQGSRLLAVCTKGK